MKFVKQVALVLLLAAPVSALADGIAATLYKNPNCTCCDEYAKYLNKNGYDVDVVATENLPAMKKEFGVPGQYAACHTTVIGEYIVEGHVPVASVDRLLQEKSDLKGIGLPGMPPGSPGMGGDQRLPLIVYSFTDSGETQTYATH